MQLAVFFDFIGGLEMSRQICSLRPLQRRESKKSTPKKGKGKKTEEKEICWKSLKKTTNLEDPTSKTAETRD